MTQKLASQEKRAQTMEWQWRENINILINASFDGLMTYL